MHLQDRARGWHTGEVGVSEYQYYEFLAIDQPLDQAQQAQLRAISTRARITPGSFTNSYEWGDLKANPLDLVHRYFDAFLYVANWNSRRLALRLPARLAEVSQLRSYGIDDQIVTIERRGEHVIVDISMEEVATEDWEDGSGRLAALSPLRAALIGGDQSLFLLLWLIEVEKGWAADDAVAPMSAPGWLPAPLGALADFLGVHPDVVTVVFGTEKKSASDSAPSEAEIKNAILSLGGDERVAFLMRLHTGSDPHLGEDLRRRCREAMGARHDEHKSDGKRMTAGDIRRKTLGIAQARKRRVEEQAAIERSRREAIDAQAKALRLETLTKRGEAVWREIDEHIDQRNAAGYERAAALLIDLSELAEKGKQQDKFSRRVASLAAQHAKKAQFLRRLREAGLIGR
jgi:hypothetical protein